MGHSNRVKQAGFTLLESVVVLLVTSFILLLNTNISVFDTSNYQLKLATTDFLSQIEQAQNWAVITNKSVSVRNLPTLDGQAIRFEIQNGSRMDTFNELRLPREISVDSFKTFHIQSGTGYIPLKTITFQTKTHRTIITFQMGMGRYRVETIKK